MEQANPSKRSDNELQYDSLIPFKNNRKGLEKFFKSVTTYKTDPAPKLFVQCLNAVMQEDSAQKDPLKILEAWEQWNNIRPQTMVKRKDLSSTDALLKDDVDKRFITYMQTLRSTNILAIPVRVFCWMVCKNGCPDGFEGYNDRGFRETNMDEIILTLKGKGQKPWNNVHNSSMHMMFRWSDEELMSKVRPDLTKQEWENMTPKEIGCLLEKWFEELDNEDLESREDLRDSLIPKAGQHRGGGIPRWVDDQPDVSSWQAVLGNKLQINFWLKLEQPIAHYLSGVRNIFFWKLSGLYVTPSQCIQDLDSLKPTVLFTDNIKKYLTSTKPVWYRDAWAYQEEWDKEELKQ